MHLTGVINDVGFFIAKMFSYIRRMKKQLIAFVFAIVVTLMVGGSITAGAQDKPITDSVAVIDTAKSQPIFHGNEENKVDSLNAVKDALSDPELKDLISSSVEIIKSFPPGGSPLTAYIGWAVAALVTAYTFFTRKKKPKAS